jgi:hypothetical protein
MCSNPGKSMEIHLRKDSVWLEAATPVVLMQNLASRYGGNADSWKKPVNDALRERMLVEEVRGGKRGYRTLTLAEYAALTAQRDGSMSGITQRVAVNV